MRDQLPAIQAARGHANDAYWCCGPEFMNRYAHAVIPFVRDFVDRVNYGQELCVAEYIAADELCKLYADIEFAVTPQNAGKDVAIMAARFVVVCAAKLAQARGGARMGLGGDDAHDDDAGRGGGGVGSGGIAVRAGSGMGSRDDAHEDDVGRDGGGVDSGGVVVGAGSGSRGVVMEDERARADSGEGARTDLGGGTNAGSGADVGSGATSTSRRVITERVTTEGVGADGAKEMMDAHTDVGEGSSTTDTRSAGANPGGGDGEFAAITLFANRNNKQSCHVVFPDVVFRSSAHVQRFVKAVNDELRRDDGDRALFSVFNDDDAAWAIDMSVYAAGRCFRTYGAVEDHQGRRVPPQSAPHAARDRGAAAARERVGGAGQARSHGAARPALDPDVPGHVAAGSRPRRGGGRDVSRRRARGRHRRARRVVVHERRAMAARQASGRRGADRRDEARVRAVSGRGARARRRPRRCSRSRWSRATRPGRRACARRVREVPAREASVQGARSGQAHRHADHEEPTRPILGARARRSRPARTVQERGPCASEQRVLLPPEHVDQVGPLPMSGRGVQWQRGVGQGLVLVMVRDPAVRVLSDMLFFV